MLHLGVCVCVAGAVGRCLRGLDVVERAARVLNLRDRRSALEMTCKFGSRRSIFCIWACLCVAGAAFGSCLKGLDVFERAARGLNLRDRRSTLEMAHRFRGRRCIFCIWVCVCVAGAAFGLCLKGLDVVERAARGLNLRDRRSTLEMAHRFRSRRSIFCIWVCVCIAGAAFGSCLKGLDVVERAARGPNLRYRRSTLEMAHRFRGKRSIFCIWVCVCVAGAAFGRCLKGLDVVERAARGLNLRDRRSTFEMACKCRGRRSSFCIWVCVCVAGAAV